MIFVARVEVVNNLGELRYLLAHAQLEVREHLRVHHYNAFCYREIGTRIIVAVLRLGIDVREIL